MVSSRGEARTHFRVRATLLVVCVGLVVGTTYKLASTPAPPVAPDLPPAESDRVYCDRGYSLIIPNGWSGRKATSRISSFSATARSSDQPFGHIHTMDFSMEEGSLIAAGAVETRFQNSPAYHSLEEKPSRKLFGHLYVTYSILFCRDDHWYQLSYSTNRRQKEMPPRIIMDYFDTFRVEPSAVRSKNTVE